MNRLGQPTAGRGAQAQAGQPVLERLQLRFRPFGPKCLPGRDRQALRPGLGFKRIQTSDPLQRLGRHRMLPPPLPHEAQRNQIVRAGVVLSWSLCMRPATPDNQQRRSPVPTPDDKASRKRQAVFHANPLTPQDYLRLYTFSVDKSVGTLQASAPNPLSVRTFYPLPKKLAKIKSF